MENSFSSEWLCLRCFPHRTRTSVPHFCTYEAYAWHLSIRIGMFLLPWKKAQPLVLQWPHAWWPTPDNFQACSSHTNYTVLCKPRHQLEKPQPTLWTSCKGSNGLGLERRAKSISLFNSEQVKWCKLVWKEDGRGSSHSNQDTSYK